MKDSGLSPTAANEILLLHIFVHHQLQKQTASVFTACINIYLPTCSVWLSLSQDQRWGLKTRKLRSRCFHRKGQMLKMALSGWHAPPPASPSTPSTKGRAGFLKQDNSELRGELQLEINYTGHGGKPGHCSFVDTNPPHKEIAQLLGSCPRDGCSVAKRHCGDN